MSDSTFTPEQIREIRRRIVMGTKGEMQYPARIVDAILAAFPPPKVTRYRTFTSDANSDGSFRVVGNVVEYCLRGLEDTDGWVPTSYGPKRERFAASLVAYEDWTALAAFADVCARPTEEVDA